LKAEGHFDLVRDFILDFNICLEDKIDNDSTLDYFKKNVHHLERKRALTRHIEYTRMLIYTVNSIDNKCLADYYVENNAVKANIFDDWDKEDSYFSQ
jgi:hypothetical protein